MNPSVNDPGEQATDKLLFYYLEGELTEEQTRTLEARLAADPALRGDLELWRAAFVVPEDDGYDTAALEKNLLKEPIPPGGTSGFRWAAGLALVAALFLTSFLTMFLLCERSPVAEERLSLPPPAERAAAPVPAPPGMKPPAPAPDRPPQPGVGAAPDRATSGNKTFNPEREDESLAAAPVPATPMPVVAPLESRATLPAVPAPEGAGLGYVKDQPVRKVKVPVSKTLTRGQRRAIARMRRRAIGQRKANEFLKGNVPYVVPLNPNSF
jgi:anti-sigma factor RsiW